MTKRTDELARLEALVALKDKRIAEARAKMRELERLLGPSDRPGVSIFAPESYPAMPVIEGVRFAAAPAAVRYKNRLDVMLITADAGSSVAGVFTRSRTRSAPVLWCEQLLAARRAGDIRPGPLAIIANSGCSNAFTGKQGVASVEATVQAVAKAVDTDARNVFMASTGVIGEPLAHDRIIAALGTLTSSLAADRWLEANRAIMTTDTYPKGAVAEVTIDGQKLRIGGFAKGAGMIAPDMATMLVFIFTDARIAEPVLQALLSDLVKPTFNSITVDGDTSTSDTLLLIASNKAAHAPIEAANDPRLAGFRRGLKQVMLSLAHQVVKDGEGATKFAAITVTGAKTKAAAHRIAMSIANSPLVKTALAGEDPNWGRIVAAVGKAGEDANRDHLSIRFGDILVAEKGWRAETYREADGAAYFKRRELDIRVDVGVGKSSATVWTCDLTHEYISVNADYRS